MCAKSVVAGFIVMVFVHLPPSLDAATAKGSIKGSQDGAVLGGSGTALCDINGDGYDDVVVASPDYTVSETNEGAVFIYLGGTAGIGQQTPAGADTTISGGIAYQHFGESVACAGDVDNDGFNDIIVGNWHFYSSDPAPFHGYIGAAYVYRGSEAGIADGDRSTADGVLLSDQDGSSFGISVAGVGDVNQDGYDDVAVGAHEYQCGGDGAAFVFLGSSTGIGDRDTLTLFDGRLCSDDIESDLGVSVAGAGDVNGDGYDDIIVGAPYYDAGDSGIQSGIALVMLGGASGVGNQSPTTVDVCIWTVDDYANIGFSVAGAGDVNGDSLADVIVGAPQYQSSAAALIFHGNATTGLAGSTAEQATTTLTGNWLDSFARTVAAAGDINRDGYDDVVVAASADEHGATEGTAFFYFGSADGVDSVHSSQASDLFLADGSRFWYWSFSAGGDIDNDTADDLVIGVPSFSEQYSYEGIAYCVHGSGPIFSDGFENGSTSAWSYQNP